MIFSDMLELASRNLRNSRLRNGLTAAGIALEDTPDGARWSIAQESDN